MPAFKTIRARAEKRKGGPKALEKLMPAKPDVEMVTATIIAINTDYNKIVQQITKEARDANTAK